MSDDRYRQALHAWAAARVPEAAKIVSVEVIDDPGYRYSSYTYEDPHVDVTVTFEDADGFTLTTSVAIEHLGEILTELFRIEDEAAS